MCADMLVGCTTVDAFQNHLIIFCLHVIEPNLILFYCKLIHAAKLNC